uniref:Uncharacterized protein n=1 Tax=Siphoviridae sp. ctxdc10 TaxID=2825740 RepID=A0A8S5TSJ5_9CAUD|nr:MAG TPA: hypothetical protein [Siphoviridae sp. ctxdc10]
MVQICKIKKTNKLYNRMLVFFDVPPQGLTACLFLKLEIH